VFPASAVAPQFAPLARWFAAVTAQEPVRALLAARGLATGGQVRAGGQVDLRPDPVRVAAMADASIALNAGYKKAASQRDAEKERAGGTVPAAAAAAAATAAPVAAFAGAGAAAGAGGVAAAASQPESNKALPDMPVDVRIAATEARLTALGIAFTTHRHAAANTVEELLAAVAPFAAVGSTACKNLFIKAKKEKAAGDSRLWLVVAAHDADTNLTKLAAKLGYGKIVLRFGEADALLENLGVRAGNVSPFCLANDAAQLVNVAVDARLLASAGPLLFHPQTNEATTAIAPTDLLKFIAATGHAHTVVDFTA